VLMGQRRIKKCSYLVVRLLHRETKNQLLAVLPSPQFVAQIGADRSVFLGEGLVSAMSEPPLTGAQSPTVGSGTNCIPGMAGGTDGGAWTTSFRARVTADAMLLDSVDSISGDIANCVGAGAPGWMLETLTALAVAGRGVDAPAGLELQCCGPPPDVSLQLSQGSFVPS